MEGGPGHLVVEVGGVGVEVKAPATTLRVLPAPGDMVTLYTDLVVKQDDISLYGFASVAERELFRTLQGVSGVGPRLALAILSGCDPSRFWQAVSRQDASLLAGIPGVGRKTVGRLLVELRDRVPAPPAELAPPGVPAEAAAPVPAGMPGDGSVRDLARDALSALGYSHRETAEAMAAALDALGPEAGADDLIVAALKWLGRQAP